MCSVVVKFASGQCKTQTADWGKAQMNGKTWTADQGPLLPKSANWHITS